MSVLTIGGVPVSVVRQPTADGSTWRIGAEGGTLGRAASGRQGGAVWWQRREWTVLTGPMTTAQVATLRAAAAVGRRVTCSGDVVGGTVACVVAITSQRVHRLKGGAFNFRLTLRLTEA